jgi:DNA polymerase elongation subunit (family B)
MTVQELENKPVESLTKQELEYLADHYETMAAKYTAYEQAVKVTLNSIYGAFGNKWFHFFNIDIAESITLQGQNAILYSEQILNKYVQEFWHKDSQAHEILGVSSVARPCHKPAVIYIDTDSCYVQFEELYNNIEWKNPDAKPTIDTFILDLYDKRLNAYIVKSMERYAEATNTDNFLMFELETVAYGGIWMSKKKYIQDIAWDDKLPTDQRHKALSKVKTIGFDTIQSSTPTLARAKLTEALKIIFTEPSGPTQETLEKLTKFLKQAKKEFKLAKIDDISFNRRTNNLEKYIVDDHIEFQIGLKCPPNVKAAGFYNFLMNNNTKYKSKYRMIGNGEKLKIYYANDPNGLSDMFAFLPGDHPYEIAPPVDYETQFEKAVIDPLNRVLTAVGLHNINRSLIYSTSLF